MIILIDFHPSQIGDCNPAVQKLIHIAGKFSSSTDPALRSVGQSLSLRQILRIAKRFQAYPGFDLHSAIYKACLARLVPMNSDTTVI